MFELLAERSTDAEERIFDNPFDFYVIETEAKRIVNDERKLADIEENLLCGRSTERFMNNERINSDRNLMMVQKINMYQRTIDDAARRKICYATMQKRLLDICFTQGKNVE